MLNFKQKVYGFFTNTDNTETEGEKPQEMIHFSWKHKDIVITAYEIIIATYNVIWHNPSSKCCTKWGPHPHHLSLPGLSTLRNSPKRWPTSSGWGLKQGLIGRIQLTEISGTQWAEWRAEETGWCSCKALHCHLWKAMEIRESPLQLEKDNCCTHLLKRAKGQSKVVDRWISRWVKVGWIIRQSG